MSYILEIQEDEEGELFVTFPEELIEELAWHEGDILNWDVRGNGIVLTKVHDQGGFDVNEE
jgi:bifunctional DNA-binding transcriptional regulator/antitoxin component of YhaV-PrlF toxin-antitoxin module